MANIGATLRETRSRARIEIAEMESRTKIRAKYLRALENEEWEMLPGPTYVKSFLRTYGDALGLDGRSLVADYKAEHEPLASDEYHALSSGLGGGRTQSSNRRRPSRLVLVILAVIVVGGAGAAFLLHKKHDTSSSGPGGALTTPAITTKTPATQSKKRKTATTTSVSVRAQAPVYVCLRSGSKRLVSGRTLATGTTVGPYRGKRFVVTVSGGAAQLRHGGKKIAIKGPGTVSYVITPTKATRAAASVTACQAVGG